MADLRAYMMDRLPGLERIGFHDGYGRSLPLFRYAIPAEWFLKRIDNSNIDHSS